MRSSDDLFCLCEGSCPSLGSRCRAIPPPTSSASRTIPGTENKISLCFLNQNICQAPASNFLLLSFQTLSSACRNFFYVKIFLLKGIFLDKHQYTQTNLIFKMKWRKKSSCMVTDEHRGKFALKTKRKGAKSLMMPAKVLGFKRNFTLKLFLKNRKIWRISSKKFLSNLYMKSVQKFSAGFAKLRREISLTFQKHFFNVSQNIPCSLYLLFYKILVVLGGLNG
jgi:hypothetical protein